MAQITNNERFPVTLPSGHVVPGATGTWDEFEFIVTSPGLLKTTNDVLRGDNAIRVRMMISSGSVATYDADPATTTEVRQDEQAMRDAQAEAEIVRGEAEAKDREAMYAAMAADKASQDAQDAKEAAQAQAAKDAEAQAQADADAALMAADETAAEEIAAVVEPAPEEPAPAKSRR